jgi:hypothetical protein
MQERKKEKNRKPIYLLFAMLTVFALLVIILIWPSEQSKAINELKGCSNKNEVEIVWNKHKEKLFADEDFIQEVRGKLASFTLSEDEINDCIRWLPPAPTSINLIVVPDLSRRINDTGQIKSDLRLLDAIWKSFREYSMLKHDTKDRLIIDVTDHGQARGQFSLIADSLQFDLSTHRGKSNRLYFTPDKDRQFRKNIIQLYKLAKADPLGADYVLYFRTYLESRLRKSTLFDNYKNKVIILTDGYLEAETGNPQTDNGVYTRFLGYQTPLYNAVHNNNILEVISYYGLNIPTANIDLSSTQILICEVDERWTGVGYDFQILKTYWTDWLERMKAKDITFIQKQPASSLTIQQLNKFINE